MKHLFKTLVCLMLVLFNFSCQKNDIIEDDLELNKNLRFTVKTLNKDQVALNDGVMKKLSTIVPKSQKGSFVGLSREIYNEAYNFTIDTDFVKLIEDSENNYQSYNFPLTRDNPEDNKLENLLLASNEDGGYDAFIVKYDVTVEELETINESELASLTTTYTPIDFDTSAFNAGELAKQTINEICAETWMYADQADNGNDHGTTCQCFGDWVLISRVCSGSSSSGGTSTGASGNTASNGNTSDNCNTCGSSGTNTANGATVTYTYVSTPTPPSTNVRLQLPEILGISDPAVLSWLTIKHNNVDATAVYDYLNEYNCAMMNAAELVACDDVVNQANDILSILSSNPDLDYNEALLGAGIVIIDSDQAVKVDPAEELNCFDLTQEATLTVYVQQPWENSDAVVGTNQVGHAFIGIEQGGIVRQVGYYPDKDSSDVEIANDYEAAIKTNYNYLYHVSISQNISSEQLTDIVNYTIGFPSTYNTNNYACTDFAINIGNLGGMNLPSTETSSILSNVFAGRSPGLLGQEIRAMNSTSTTTISTTSANSPERQGGCTD
jgi:hypothetical protein